MPASSTATVTLRTRKGPPTETGVLHLSSSPSPGNDTHSESEYEPQHEAGPSILSIQPPAPKNAVAAHRKGRYPCTYEGCLKSYSKPSRLAEHERSHSGDVRPYSHNTNALPDLLPPQRPFICPTCNKSYLRESHLQAHSRSHLSYSDRPYVCDEPGCGKRFWTTQHLRVHNELHNGEKPFKVRLIYTIRRLPLLNPRLHSVPKHHAMLLS